MKKLSSRSTGTRYTAKIFILLFPLFFLLNSCLGINADIVLNQNGSGTLALEYHIAKILDSLGTLDGNERWNTIPVGKADFERTLERLPEMKLLSFSSKENGKDLVIAAKMEFSSLQGLLGFLDASGQRSSYSGSSSSHSLLLTFTEGSGIENASLDKLIAVISENYRVRMSMTFPREGSLSITDRQGMTGSPIRGSEITTQGKKVSCSFPLYEILASKEGINAVFRW